MTRLIVISHPEVAIDPTVDITDWSLDDTGRRRAEVFAKDTAMAKVAAIWSSAERKAVETAEILAKPRMLSVSKLSSLGENDRSSTGFLPRDQFEAAADAFFSKPETSFQGWETAIAAQARVLEAVRGIAGAHEAGDLAIVTHGAVGTLLWCALSGRPIDRCFDQPSQGHYWLASLPALLPETRWRPFP